MKTKILTFAILTTLVISSRAQENYNVIVSGKQRIVTGSVEFNKGDRTIFANALMWAIEQGNELKELVTDCDFEKMRFEMTNNMAEEGQTTFSSILTVQVNQGRLIYLVSDIKGQGGGLSSVLGGGLISFDRMNPEKKPKQQAMIDDFEKVNTKTLKQLISFVREHDVDVSYWNCFLENKIENNMSVEDVKIVLGKPLNILKDGNTTQYMYNPFTYVFFENNKVKSFIK